MKKSVTYILSSEKNVPALNRQDWVRNDVGINKKPNKIIRFGNGYRIEKYLLNTKETGYPKNPNIIKTIERR